MSTRSFLAERMSLLQSFALLPCSKFTCLQWDGNMTRHGVLQPFHSWNKLSELWL